MPAAPQRRGDRAVAAPRERRRRRWSTARPSAPISLASAGTTLLGPPVRARTAAAPALAARPSSSRRQPSMNAVRGPLAKRPCSSRSSSTNSGRTRSCSRARGDQRRDGRAARRSRRNQTIAVGASLPAIRRIRERGPAVQSAYARAADETSRSSRSASWRCRHEIVPLHIFEPRYRTMISECLDDGARVRDRLGRPRTGCGRSAARWRSPRSSSAARGRAHEHPHARARGRSAIVEEQLRPPLSGGRRSSSSTTSDEPPTSRTVEAAHEAYREPRRAGDRPRASTPRSSPEH